MNHFLAGFEKRANLFKHITSAAGKGIEKAVSLTKPQNLPPFKRDPKVVAQADKVFKRLMGKAAASLYGATRGLKALNRGNSAGSAMTARPTSMMATVGRTTAGPLPSASVPKSHPATALPKQPAGTKLSPNSKGNVQKIDAAPGVSI